MNKKNKIKLGLLTTALIFIALTIWSFFIPREFHYQKKIDIVAQQRMIFVFIGELKRWREWTKWVARDEDMTEQFSEPSYGQNATYKWDTWAFGNKSGQLTVIDFRPPDVMAYEVQPNDGWEKSLWRIQLTEAPRQGSTITWTVDGSFPENRFWRLISYIGQWRLEGDLTRGLERLKKHAELHEAYDVKGDWEK